MNESESVKTFVFQSKSMIELMSPGQKFSQSMSKSLVELQPMDISPKYENFLKVNAPSKSSNSSNEKFRLNKIVIRDPEA